MEFRLSTLRNVLIGLLVVFVVIALGRAALENGLTLPWAKPTPTPEPTPIPDGREAAIAGATAFLSVDVTRGRDAWLESVCAVSTENGCAFAELFVGANWETAVAEQKARTRYEVQEASLHRDLGDGRQIWKLTGVVHDLNTQRQSTGEMYVLVMQEGGTWKYDHMLFDQELKALEAQP